jgi:hypothetical protein
MIRSLCLPAAALVTSFVQAALGQDPAASLALPENKAQIEAALKLTKEAAAKYEFIIGADQKPVLMPEPVLKWSNPSVGEIHGNVFLWTLNGRPAIVGSIFKWFSPHTHMSHEFHSFCEQPLRGKYEGADVWTTIEGGLKFARAADLPVPAAGKPQRLLQMRDFARNCAATKHEKDGSLTELRLLTQPIHRYAVPADGLVDGGLFVFVLGTDPELFVLLEARESSGKQEWQFAVTRMNSVAVSLRYKDRELWKVEAMSGADVYSHKLPYTSFMHKMP